MAILTLLLILGLAAWWYGMLLPVLVVVLALLGVYFAVMSIGFFRADKVEARRNALAVGGFMAALDGTARIDNDPGENRQVQFGAAAETRSGGQLIRNAKLSISALVRAFR